MIGCGIGLTTQRRRATAAAWSPALLSGKLLWVRGDLGVTLVSGKVVQWDDQSGNGAHLIAQGTSSTQPIQTTWAAGLNTAACYFDGNDKLATTSGVLPTADGAGYTIFTVVAFDDLAGRTALITSGTAGGVGFSQSIGGDSKLEHWKVGVAFDSDGAARTTPLNVITTDQVGAAPASTMWVNGSLVATTAPNAGVITPSGKLYVGAAATTLFHKGHIAELLIISGRATAPVIASWNAYSLGKYGV